MAHDGWQMKREGADILNLRLWHLATLSRMLKRQKHFPRYTQMDALCSEQFVTDVLNY